MSTQGKPFLVWLMLGSFFVTSLVGVAEAGSPKEQMRQTIDRLLVIIADPSLKSPERAAERRERIRQVLVQRFDFRDMARRTLGRRWYALKPEQRREFVSLFSVVLERYYINEVENFGGGPEDIQYINESVDADGYASVATKIVNPHDPERDNLEYLLVRRNGDWQVYDVVVEEVSMINNYRLQFSKILRRESYPDLMQRLKTVLETDFYSPKK